MSQSTVGARLLVFEFKLLGSRGLGLQGFRALGLRFGV